MFKPTGPIFTWVWKHPAMLYVLLSSIYLFSYFGDITLPYLVWRLLLPSLLVMKDILLYVCDWPYQPTIDLLHWPRTSKRIQTVWRLFAVFNVRYIALVLLSIYAFYLVVATTNVYGRQNTHWFLIIDKGLLEFLLVVSIGLSYRGNREVSKHSLLQTKKLRRTSFYSLLGVVVLCSLLLGYVVITQSDLAVVQRILLANSLAICVFGVSVWMIWAK